jgi:NAD(P)-dependent dehydrogenase (short-subunit alcohol dehydrogenase family)
MNRDLTDKVVAITGAFGSLGTAVARAVETAGGRLALLDQAGTAPTGFTDPLLLGEVDLSSPEAAHAAFATIVQRFGRLYALVNVAGAFRWETVEAGTVDTWDLLYRVNLRTAVNTSHAALPYLLQQRESRIVNVGAGAAARAAAGMGAYAASKSGVARLTEALSEECKDRGLTVNAVLPSIIDTPANRADMPQADFARWVSPHQVAELIVFLLSRGAAAITGASIPISGRV